MDSAERLKKDMNVILLMGLFPPEIRADVELNSKGAIQYAADALQWALVKGLDLFFNVKIINLPFIGSYPFRFKRLKPYRFNFEHIPGADDINIGFVNLPMIKMVSRYRNAKKELLRTLSQVKGKTAIIIYSLNSPFLKAAVDIKRKYPTVRIGIIIPDMLEYMSDNKNIFYRLLKWIDGLLIKKEIMKADFFVLLSDYMAEALQIVHKPHVRIEGIYDSSDSVDVVSKEKYKTILYSGTLARRYGIMNLVKAFSLIDKADYRLWICGEGDCREEIKNLTKTDSRVTYFGQISRTEVQMLQKKATVLVNPRTSEGEFTKFSFPSKTMEYLASGTPCIIHRLKGIPDEYFQYCFVSDKENAEGLKEMILTVCEKEQTELNEFGKRASRFIREHKNPAVQVKKIYDMLNKTGY